MPDKKERPAVSKKKCHPTVLASVLIAALGGFLLGFNSAVLSGAAAALRNYFLLDPCSLNLVLASALIGTVFGAIGAGRIADIFGRQASLLGIAFIFLISALGCATAWSSQVFVVARVLSGIAMGAASVVVPIYIAEISPAGKRGQLVCIFQLTIVIGILASFISNYLIALAPQSEEAAWRWMLGVAAVPSALYLVLLLLTPESPRWLVLKERPHEAVAILSQLGILQATDKVAAIRASLSQEVLAGGREPLLQSKYSRPLLLVWTLAMFNQLSGVNALMYYAPSIFAIAGAGRDSSLLQSIAVGSTCFLFTIVAILTIDTIGRRKLIQIGSIGMGVCMLIVAWQFSLPLGWDRWMILLGLLGFIAFFSLSQGAVIWVFMSEIFPNAIRAKGQSFGAAIHWGMAAIISWIFPMVVGGLPSLAFVFFALLMLLQFLWTLYIMPETKGKTLEENQDLSPPQQDEDWG